MGEWKWKKGKKRQSAKDREWEVQVKAPEETEARRIIETAVVGQVSQGRVSCHCKTIHLGPNYGP